MKLGVYKENSSSGARFINRRGKNKGEKQGHSWTMNIWEGYALVGVDGVGCVWDGGAGSTSVPPPPNPCDAKWPWGSHAVGTAVRQEVPSSPCGTLARLFRSFEAFPINCHKLVRIQADEAGHAVSIATRAAAAGTEERHAQPGFMV